MTVDKWDAVEAVFDEGTKCEECPHFVSYPDRWDEPGGTECALMDGPRRRFAKVNPQPEDCHGFEAAYKELQRQADEDH
jgi:hypothetical protein